MANGARWVIPNPERNEIDALSASLGIGAPAAKVLIHRGLADPACARHGAERGQVDISARMIRIFEYLGWATSVHWPDPDRLAAHRRNSAA